MIKSIFFLLIFSLIFKISNGQALLLDRIHDLAEAGEIEKSLEVLEMAEQNDATKNDPRTYYLKSYIFKSIYDKTTTPTDSIRQIAISSLNKARQLDKNSLFTLQLNELEIFFYSSIFNSGVKLFNEQDYLQSSHYFNRFLTFASPLNPYWQDGHYYAGICQYMMENLDSAVFHYEILYQRDYNEELLYADLSSIYLFQEQLDKATMVIQKGLNKYPDNYDLQIVYLNVLSSNDEYSKLQEKLETLILKYPNEVDLLLMLGTAYNKLKSQNEDVKYFDLIEEIYQKALKISPNSFDANFNLGVHYYNEAVEIINANDYDISIFELGEILERSTELFNKALPYLQHIYSSNKEIKLLVALQAIYYNLNMTDELLTISKELELLSK